MPSNKHSIDVAHVKDGHPRSGHAVLVDRLWPRGQRKDEAPWDEWLKAVAPTTELRKWYGHDPEKHDEFVRRYSIELEGDEPSQAFEHLRKLHQSGNLTLMTATKDLDTSQAKVLEEMLLD